MIIDMHAHLLPQSAVRAAESGDEWHGSRFERGPQGNPVVITGTYQVGMGASRHWEPPARRLERMDDMGIDMQILSLNPILFRYYIDRADGISASQAVNDEIASMIEEWPDRFAGFAALPMQDPAAAIVELERAVKTLGLKGAAVGTHVNGLNWDEPELFGVLEAAEDLGAALFVHPSASRLKDALPRYHMRNYIGNPTETTIAVGSMIFGGVIDRLPDLKIAFAHGGGYACWGSARFDHGYSVREEAREQIDGLPSDYLKRLYFDSLVHGALNLRHLVDVVGVEKVLLGTDYPADMGQPDPITWIDGCDVTPAERAAILGGNAQELFEIV